MAQPDDKRERVGVNVSLTPELARFLEAKVGAGTYASASEVVREGLRLLLEQDDLRKARLEELRENGRVGLDRTRRGELVSADGVAKPGGLDRGAVGPLVVRSFERALLVKHGLTERTANVLYEAMTGFRECLAQVAARVEPHIGDLKAHCDITDPHTVSSLLLRLEALRPKIITMVRDDEEPYYENSPDGEVKCRARLNFDTHSLETGPLLRIADLVPDNDDVWAGPRRDGIDSVHQAMCDENRLEPLGEVPAKRVLAKRIAARYRAGVSDDLVDLGRALLRTLHFDYAASEEQAGVFAQEFDRVLQQAPRLKALERDVGLQGSLLVDAFLELDDSLQNS